MVTGLAWTSVGGETMPVEVAVMDGTGKLELTGSLGDVMKESAQTALTYVRSVCPEYGIADDYFEKHDLHIHIPEERCRRTDLLQELPWPQPCCPR